VVSVYVPGQALLKIGNGNANELDVPDLIVNEGVVNITVLELPQLRPSGPDNVNFTATFCGALMQSVTLDDMVTNPGRFTVEGLIPTEA